MAQLALPDDEMTEANLQSGYLKGEKEGILFPNDRGKVDGREEVIMKMVEERMNSDEPNERVQRERGGRVMMRRRTSGINGLEVDRMMMVPRSSW